MPNADKFFETLFEPNERTCFSREVYETRLKENYITADLFFAINPLKDNRRDSNVTSFRNILCEFDNLTIPEQLEFIKKSGVPFTALTFSGSKSIHMIISLEKPLANIAEYRALVKRIYAKLAPHVDTSTGNPSRFSRIPGAIRDGGREQSLLACLKRVPNEKLEAWLGPAPKEIPRVSVPMPHKGISPRAFSFLRYGAPAGAWNANLFKAALDLASAGYTQQEIIELVHPLHGYVNAASKRTIASACRTAAQSPSESRDKPSD
jgi:hypothetical protein